MTIASVTLAHNTEGIIADAIESVVDQVDFCLLVDTGITDATLTRARAAAKGKLKEARHRWTDFSSARNYALSVARGLGATWALVLDTDERFLWQGADLRSLSESVDSYLIESADHVYWKEKIVRLASDAHWHGPTHEVVIAARKESLHGVLFDELPKSYAELQKKQTRDVAMLTDWLAQPENETDGRWWYYLGDALHGLGLRDRAIDAFDRCVTCRTVGDEEGAWAAYRQAECLIEREEYKRAVEAAARGFSRHAGVAELAWLGAVASYRLGQPAQAMHWARIAIGMGRYAPAAGHVIAREYFTHPPALYELPFDILRYVTTGAEREDAERHFARAKALRLGAETREQLEVVSVQRKPERHEARAMLRPPTLAARLGKGLHLPKVIDLSPKPETLKGTGLEHYHPCNPSVCVFAGKLFCNLRLVNYVIDEAGRYVIGDPDQKVRTVNLLGTLRLEGPESHQDGFCVVSDVDPSPRSPASILGYEDVRLFVAQGRLMASATTCDRGEDRCKIVRLEFNDVYDIARATVEETGRWHEKNWMPIAGAHTDIIPPTWLYELDPTTVRFADGAMETQRCPLALEHLRGGSQAIAVQGGYLCVVHEVIHSDQGRLYLHRFVRLDGAMKVAQVSPSWTFEEGYGIEFCAGLARNPADPSELVLSYGVKDAAANLLVLREAHLDRLDWIG